MNLSLKSASILTVFAIILVLSGCKKKNADPDIPEKTALAALSKTWNIVSAHLDNTDRTDDFAGFSLSISGTFNSSEPSGPYNFSVSGSRPTPSPWPQSGSWSFGSNPQSNIIRNEIPDGTVAISYNISNGTLTLEFECQDCNYASARVDAVAGVWTFVLN